MEAFVFYREPGIKYIILFYNGIIIIKKVKKRCSLQQWSNVSSKYSSFFILQKSANFCKGSARCFYRLQWKMHGKLFCFLSQIGKFNRMFYKFWFLSSA